MKRFSTIGILGLIAILFIGMAISPYYHKGYDKALLKAGDSFPRLKLEGLLTAAEKIYLGVPDSNRFGIEDIKAELIIIEFFNKYCAHCQQFAPILNELYFEIEQNPILKNKVKLLGVGLGNSSKQIQIYQAEQHIPFPLMPDLDFKIHDELGRPKAPFTVIVKKTTDQNGTVSATYLGIAASKDEFLKAIEELLQPDVLVLSDSSADNTSGWTKIPTANTTEEDFLIKVKECLQANGFMIKKLEPITIDNNTIYKAQLTSKNRTSTFFFEEVFRNTVCDVCHDAHFWYGFDLEGNLTHFVPIYLPKSFNRQWDQDDIKKYRQQLVGQSIFQNFEFDPATDAITSATITSSLIFDTINKTKLIFKRLQEEEIIKK